MVVLLLAQNIETTVSFVKLLHKSFVS